MLNDRFNGGDQNDFKNKFRDKKFVSTVAIGIFVFALLIVLLFGKGCKSKSQPKQQPKPPVPVVTGNPGAPAEVAPAVTNGNDKVVAPQPDLPDDSMIEKQKQIDENKAKGKKLIQEGRKYLNGNEKIKKDHKKARACFQKAKKLGHPDADFWLKKCK